MIGNGSMIVFVICSIIAILLMALFFINNARIERRERMLDEELMNYAEDSDE